MSKYKIVGQKEFDEIIKDHEEWLKTKDKVAASIHPTFSGHSEFRGIKTPAKFCLVDMTFRKCRFVDCNFQGIRLDECFLHREAEFVRCNFDCSNWAETDRGYVNVVNAAFRDCTFYGSSFVRCAMNDVQFEHCDFTEAELLNCSFGLNSFSRCNLTLKGATPATINLIRAVNEVNIATIKCEQEHWS